MTKPKKSESCVVLVTGASGFLGQHVVGLLQEKADHVTEIRVLDREPYVNKLDYKERLPVTQYTGSINDHDLVLKACAGVTCVFHLASLIDISMFPDTSLLEEVNVRGTETIISASQKACVQRIIYCSSVEVVLGSTDIIGGTESSTRIPDTFHLKYAQTKAKAEGLVLCANDPLLTTMAIRPVGVYGECAKQLVTSGLKRIAKRKSSTFRKISYGGPKQQFVYAGNAAWMFICAEKELFRLSREKTTFPKNKIGGETFFCCDDTPVLASEDFTAVFKEACGFREAKPSVPGWVVKCILMILFCILYVVRLVRDVNCFYGLSILRTIELTWWFKYDKAKELLRYRPLYNWQQSKERSLVYYNSFCKTT